MHAGVITARQTRLIGERVRALATILLTRREDVSIQELAEDIGLGLIVTIQHEEKPGLRQFGVKTRGVWARLTAEDANAVLSPSMRKLLRDGPFPYPVVLFLYTMEDGGGWYTWATGPYIGSNGDFELRANEEASCRRLEEKAPDEIIGRVGAWHVASFAKTIKGTPRERKE